MFSAFVVNADVNPPRDEYDPSKALFVKCDVRVWEDQVAVFKTAIEHSPKHGIDIVIANAGVYGPDILEGIDEDEPSPANLKLIEINLFGVIHTAKLAAFYFNKQPRESFDRCLILVTSIMGYIDTQGSSLYGASKHGVRGLMACLRRKGLMRVNALAPWFVATGIFPENFRISLTKQFQAQGVDFAAGSDAVGAIMRIVTDSSINGRSIAIVPRQLSPSGYLDMELDDFQEGSPCDKLQRVAGSLSYSDII
ncbi:Uncharacterized protein BP5553_09774 [Venustampulla echinocandica]|uniref:NAD(P)-binding protein n=1 Tax=Venustampulla echinocandica TaxID=2656787 RepID=A0A370TAM3_9HELO|nr:Uncharacterized protein BP5553_09774 [Venustampulla echinocandica]RDL30985.1 Uncharacterized protein BP5553_09774 [Venustampulla echinocandica]